MRYEKDLGMYKCIDYAKKQCVVYNFLSFYLAILKLGTKKELVIF